MSLPPQDALLCDSEGHRGLSPGPCGLQGPGCAGRCFPAPPWRQLADVSRPGLLSVLSAACLPKASLRKGIDYRILQKGHLSFLLSKTASRKALKALEKCDPCPRQLGSSCRLLQWKVRGEGWGRGLASAICAPAGKVVLPRAIWGGEPDFYTP